MARHRDVAVVRRKIQVTQLSDDRVGEEGLRRVVLQLDAHAGCSFVVLRGLLDRRLNRYGAIHEQWLVARNGRIIVAEIRPEDEPDKERNSCQEA